MIEEEVAPVRRLHGAAMAGTLPVAIGSDDWVLRVLLPRAEQLARARHAQRVAAGATAAGIARIEVIKPRPAPQDERTFGDCALPQRVVAHDLLALPQEARTVFGELLRVDRGRLKWPRVVAVGLPNEERLAAFVAHKVRVNRADILPFG